MLRWGVDFLKQVSDSLAELLKFLNSNLKVRAGGVRRWLVSENPSKITGLLVETEGGMLKDSR